MTAPAKNIMRLIVIKTKHGAFITRNIDNASYNNSSFDGYIINGEIPESTFHRFWFKISEVPEIIQTKVRHEDINHRYLLKDKSMANDKIPLEFIRDIVANYDRDEYYWVWKPEYAQLCSLYELVSDSVEDTLEDVEFEIIKTFEFDEIEESNGFSYPIQKNHWRDEEFGAITEKEAQHQMLDRIVFPEVALPSRPSKLSSAQSYKIIRKFVQDNIDPRYAKITSDYDFCFTVKKKIPLSETETYTVDVNFMTKKRAKYIKKYRTDREIEIFEMTYSPKGYNDYTPIPPFVGENHDDLKKNIDKYLKNLITEINEPLTDCPHCKGMGVIEGEK